MTYLTLFSYRTIASHPDPSYSQLISPEALKFYKYSTLTYKHLGNEVFKDVYGVVENLQTYFVSPSAYSMTFKRFLYESSISIDLEKAN